jgi:hypothetical protein
MNECFKNIVGINGLCENENYKYWLDDIGISFLSTVKTVDSKFNTGANLVTRKIEQAWNETFKDLTAQGFSFNKVLCEVDMKAEGQVNVLQNGTKAITISKSINRMTSISFHNVKFDGSGEYTLTISDGVETYSYTGEDSRLTIDNRFFGDEITITLEYISINNRDRYSDGSCCDNSCNLSIDSDGNTYGLYFSVQETCDYESYFCKYANLIGDAVVYKAGALILKELVDSDRINDFKIVKEQDLWTRIAYLDSSLNLYAYQNQVIQSSTSTVEVKDGRYQIELARLNKILPKPKDKYCLTCVGNQYKITIP